MAEQNDHELLEDFAHGGADSAFAALVARYVNLVYSTAMRFTGNPDHAEEITQAVFVVLARKAVGLRRNVVLSGWLYQAARLTASNFRKNEIRRQLREQEAFMQSTTNEPDAAWEEIAPMLDDAMGGLGETDRAAIVLRFFQNRTAAEAARELNLTEAATHKRVNRALDKLRKFFTGRGLTLSTAIIASAVSANSVQAAPAGVAASVAAAKGGVVSTTITMLVKGTMKAIVSWKLKMAAGLGVALLLAGGTATIVMSGGKPDASGETAQQDPVLIVPGESVGVIKKGMTTNEVQAVLGKPDRMQGRIMVYDKNLGMCIAPAGTNGVQAVLCGDSMLGYPGVKKFKGRTKEGVGMLSTRQEVISAFGQPTTAMKDNRTETLEYKSQGLNFTLESGKVIHMIVDFRQSK